MAISERRSRKATVGLARSRTTSPGTVLDNEAADLWWRWGEKLRRSNSLARGLARCREGKAPRAALAAQRIRGGPSR